MTFKPYTPPNAGDGPLTLDRDLCWRVAGDPQAPSLVTPAVVGVVAWAIGHLRVTKAQEKALLDGLGLEWHEEPMGGMSLHPRDEFFQAVDA